MKRLLLPLLWFAALGVQSNYSFAAGSSSGVVLSILSPRAVAYAGDTPIHASVDLDVGEGAGSDFIRERPDLFQLCTSWWDDDDDDVIEYHDNDIFMSETDKLASSPPTALLASEDKGRKYCCALFQCGELPSLVPRWLAASARASAGPCTFRAWLQQQLPTAGGVPAGLPVAVAWAQVHYHVLPERCLVGVVLSGTLRTFVSPIVRRRFVAAMSTFRRSGVGGAPSVPCDVEILAHVPKPSVAGAQQEVPQFTALSEWRKSVPSFEATESQIRHAIKELNASLSNDTCVSGSTDQGTLRLVHVVTFAEKKIRTSIIPSEGGTVSLGHRSAHAQLAKLAAAFDSLVLPREEHLGRRYSWLVRCRWDLAWLARPPSFESLRHDAISVPYTSWPISDQFAVVPRHLARPYFHAHRTRFREEHPNDPWVLPGEAGTEVVLLRNLLEHRVPIRFIEVCFAALAAAHFERRSF